MTLYDAKYREQSRAGEQKKIKNELMELHRMTPQEIAEQADRRCVRCGELITPKVEEYEVLSRGLQRVIIWPDEHECEVENGPG